MHRLDCDYNSEAPFITLAQAKTLAQAGNTRTRRLAVDAGALVSVDGLVRVDRDKFTSHLREIAVPIA